MPQTPPQTDTYSTALDIFDRTHPLRVDSDENLKVTVAGSGGVTIGTVDQGLGGTSPWLVTGTVIIALSTTAVTTAVVVTTSPTLLLAANLSRKGFIVQNTTGVVFVKFDSTSSTALYGYELPRKAILEKDNYSGDVAAVTAAGSVTVYVTELV